MTPEITDKLGRPSNPDGYSLATTVITDRAVSATVLEAFDLGTFSVDTPVYFFTYKKTVDPVTNEVTITDQTGWKALVNADNNTLTNLELAPGYTDIGNDVGDYIECVPTSYWGNQLIDFLFETHNPDGTLKTEVIDDIAESAADTALNTGLTADNLRVKPRATVTTSIASLTPNIDSYNVYDITAQAAALAIADPTGTPNNGDVLLIRIKDNGTARAITYGSAYVNVSGLPSLSTTVINKWHTLGIVYNSTAAKWHIISINSEA